MRCAESTKKEGKDNWSGRALEEARIPNGWGNKPPVIKQAQAIQGKRRRESFHGEVHQEDGGFSFPGSPRAGN